MGNPHPTRSKPVKIGRKHTHREGVRQRAKRENGERIAAAIKKAKEKRRRNLIRKFWQGELDVYPF